MVLAGRPMCTYSAFDTFLPVAWASRNTPAVLADTIGVPGSHSVAMAGLFDHTGADINLDLGLFAIPVHNQVHVYALDAVRLLTVLNYHSASVVAACFAVRKQVNTPGLLIKIFVTVHPIRVTCCAPEGPFLFGNSTCARRVCFESAQ